MKKIYQVVQGVIGGYHHVRLQIQGEFTNLQEAKKYFNEIKKDVNGWNIGSNQKLHTSICLYFQFPEMTETISTYNF